MLLHNHVTTSLSELESQMISHVPPGGNWQDIPSGLSARVDQIRERSKTRGLIHTTYYGRLRWDAPAYTISTFFSRSGNGCFIHPEQERLISAREAARLQSFPDDFVFTGPQRSVATQIGNAVPPLLAKAVGEVVPGARVVDLFSGAGGLSLGLELSGKKVLLAAESDKHTANTYEQNHPGVEIWRKPLGSPETTDELAAKVKELGGCDLLAGGPPCQSFSTAGRRSADLRSQLVSLFVEVIKKLRPENVLMENVLGLKSFQRGELLRRTLQELEDAGYYVSLWDLRAERYGVPQRRRRVFVCGSLSSSLSPPEPLVPLYVKDLSAYTSVQEAIGSLPPLNVGSGISPIEAELPEPVGEYECWLRGESSLEEYLSSVWLKVQREHPEPLRLDI